MVKSMSVKYRVLAILTLLTVISVVVLIYFSNFIDSWKTSDRLDKEGTVVIQILAAVIASDVKTRDLLDMEKKVKDVMQNLQNVSRVIVYDNEDNELLNWKIDRKSDLNNSRYFKKQIRYEGDHIGAVKIAIDSLQLYESDYEYSNYAQSFSVLLLLLLGLFTALAVSLLLISPLERITNSLTNSATILEGNKNNLKDFKKLNETVYLLKQNIQLRQERERETEHTKLQLVSVLDTVGEAIITISKEGFIIMANKATEKAWGYSIDELIGMDMTVLMPEKYREGHKNGIKRYIETGKAKVLNTRIELEALRANGEIFPIEIYISETFIDDELMFTAALRDITERKHAENELHEAKFKIEEILETRTNELKESQLLLIQTEKLETIGTLSAGVAHEVKNPLAIIQLGVDYLIKKAHNSQDVNEVINEMDDAIQRADKVIKQLVDFSASRDVYMSKVNVSELLDDALDLVKHEITKAKIKVNKVMQDHDLLIEGDKQKLQQVLINIFMNSIYAIESNGMIDINAQKKKLNEVSFDITGSYKLEDEIIEITIDDNGSGVPEDKLEKIFDPFFTTKPAGKGTGLGLTVVQNILRLHKSKIHYENKQGGGVKVTILVNSTGA
jgi:PAS domain S-box-containing protein